MQEQGAGRSSGTVLIRARHSGTVACVVLTIVWAVALAVPKSAGLAEPALELADPLQPARAATPAMARTEVASAGRGQDRLCQ